MGMFMRTNLFHGVGHEEVFAALADFWAGEGYPVQDPAPGEGSVFTLYEAHGGWTALTWTSGWEWDLRRRAQFHVSRVLDCPGLLTFVYDGDYWGYELFHHGVPVDRFVQWPHRDGWFDDLPCTGQPDVVAAQFPGLALDPTVVGGYLGAGYDDADLEDMDWLVDEDDPRNAPVREGDASGPLDPMAFLDFWRLLGVATAYDGNRWSFRTPAVRRFTTLP